MTSPNIVRLTHVTRPLLVGHFTRLSIADRKMRFGMPVNDEYIANYVARMDFVRDEVFGIFDDDLRIVACSHFAARKGSAELGLSVDREFRGRCYGDHLFKRAIIFAKSKDIHRVFMVCLSENGPIMRLARKNGMEVVTEHGEADAHINLKFTPLEMVESSIQESVLDKVAIIDVVLFKYPLKLVSDYYDAIGKTMAAVGQTVRNRPQIKI